MRTKRQINKLLRDAPWPEEKTPMPEKKIVEAKIGPMPKSLFDAMPDVTVKFDDGTEKRLYEFYPDEIQFTPAEFIGLTEAEAIRLKTQKDVRWLQS